MYYTILFSPLIGFLIAGLFGRAIGDRGAEIVTTTLMVFTALFSWIAFFAIGYGDEGVEHTIQLFQWINSGTMNVSWSIRVDTLTVVMLVVVNTVSALVHLYSIGYMHDDPHRARFFAYLSLFTFAMLMLVTSDNFLQLFFGWEGVGLASYLLIGFWYQKPSACAAAMKAFIVNRVGDFGFALGIFGVFVLFDSVDFSVVFATAPDMQGKMITFLWQEWDAMTVVCLLLFMGAMGKSAQFLLHTWLPDAMEGPTPVSALIHAATMVTAGVFMVARLSPLFEQSETALMVVTVVGAVTAFFAATVGLVQNDIKRVIAYSTCSQLGYMFAALGVGAYTAGIFHLFTHAFFKALLFLGAGSVIHAMHHEQDMRKMGGVAKYTPITYWMMMIGTLALTGVGIPGTPIGFAGFFSKDTIIEATYAAHSAHGTFAFWLLVIAALFTSFYSWRLVHLTFHGRTRATAEVISHAHESPKVMLIPLYVLAIGAVVAGVVFKGVFVGDGLPEFWRIAIFSSDNHEIIEHAHHVPFWVKSIAGVMMLLGFVGAYVAYIMKPDLPAEIAKRFHGLYQFLLNKWYFDELYDRIFVKPCLSVGQFFWKVVDDMLIDFSIVGGIAASVRKLTGRVVLLQTGYVYHYAFAMLIGIAALMTWAIFKNLV